MESAAGDLPPVDQGLFLLHLNRARKGVRDGRLEPAGTGDAPAGEVRAGELG